MTALRILTVVMMVMEVTRADVPICTHDTMGSHAFCFPPEYNKVNKIARELSRSMESDDLSFLSYLDNIQH